MFTPLNGVIAPFFGVIKIQCGVIISHVFPDENRRLE
jgi:hypothetical protein